MVKISVLADNLKTMSNAEKRGRRQVMLRPSSKVVVKFLQQMMKHGACTLCTLRLRSLEVSERFRTVLHIGMGRRVRGWNVVWGICGRVLSRKLS